MEELVLYGWPRVNPCGTQRCIDFTVNHDISTDLEYLNLCNISAGTGLTQRVGTRIAVYRLEVYLWWHNTTLTSYESVQRILIYADRQSNSVALPDVTDLLEHSADNWSTVSPIKYSNSKRYLVILDESFVSGGLSSVVNGSTGTPTSGVIRKGVTLSEPLVIEYNPTYADDADVVSNNLWMATTGSGTAGATDVPLRGYVRVFYNCI